MIGGENRQTLQKRRRKIFYCFVFTEIKNLFSYIYLTCYSDWKVVVDDMACHKTQIQAQIQIQIRIQIQEQGNQPQLTTPIEK